MPAIRLYTDSDINVDKHQAWQANSDFIQFYINVDAVGQLVANNLQIPSASIYTTPSYLICCQNVPAKVISDRIRQNSNSIRI